VLIAEALAIAAAGVLLPSLTISVLHRTINGQQQALLSEQAELIRRNLKVTDGVSGVALPEPWRSVYAHGFDGRSYLLVDDRGVVRQRTPGSGGINVASIPRGASPRPFTTGNFIGWSKPAGSGPRPLWIVVLQNETFPGAIIDDIARTFVSRYVAVLTLLLLLIPAINWFLIERIIRGVRHAADQAAAIGPQTLSVRIDEKDLPIEIGELASAINRLVARLEKGLGEQRAFVGNLVHELRTPLARMRLQVDRVEEPKTRLLLAQSVDHLSHVVTQMRDLAELEVIDEHRFPVDLNEAARSVVAGSAPLVYEAGASIEFTASEAPVVIEGRPVLVELAIRNLVDNAMRHTPAGTHIVVAVGPGAVVRVADNGPGLSAETQQFARNRFWRADWTRSDSAGLGLSIVERICEVHGATLRIENRVGGGADCAIEFAA
jgi:signal transduction histidine kinase